MVYITGLQFDFRKTDDHKVLFKIAIVLLLNQVRPEWFVIGGHQGCLQDNTVSLQESIDVLTVHLVSLYDQDQLLPFTVPNKIGIPDPKRIP